MKKAFLAIAIVALPLALWRAAPGLSGLWSEMFYEPPPAVEHEGMERFDPNVPGWENTELMKESIAQYSFARDYAKEHGLKSVADIASGTCYGMAIMKQTVPLVEGYDKEDLCGNYVLDLDVSDWGREYDAIVSFETLEHLKRPEFFLENAARSAPVLIISTVVNEVPGVNPFHVVTWNLEELRTLLAKFYTCEELHRVGSQYAPGFEGPLDYFAVCKRR